jgi:hypothetical protein
MRECVSSISLFWQRSVPSLTIGRGLDGRLPLHDHCLPLHRCLGDNGECVHVTRFSRWCRQVLSQGGVDQTMACNQRGRLDKCVRHYHHFKVCLTSGRTLRSRKEDERAKKARIGVSHVRFVLSQAVERIMAAHTTAYNNSNNNKQTSRGHITMLGSSVGIQFAGSDSASVRITRNTHNESNSKNYMYMYIYTMTTTTTYTLCLCDSLMISRCVGAKAAVKRWCIAA